MPYAQCVRNEETGSANSAKLGELALLHQIRRRAAFRHGSGLSLGIGDDCALLHPRAGEELAVTTDLSIAGRHFRLDWHAPEAVGHRTLARGLSDLAAMGARPVAAFLSLGLPRQLTAPASIIGTASRRASGSSWMTRFLDGLLALAAAHKTPLAGGDLSESPIAVADIALIGAVPRGRALLRSRARPGDLLYVTGSLGGSAAGLARLSNLAGSAGDGADGPGPGGQPPHIPQKLQALLAPHLYPQPRIAQGLWLLRRRLATAAIDLSDGLSTDLNHLCEESGVAAEVDAASLPIHPAASQAQALNGGEDYELLFTAEPAARVPRQIAGIRISRIGRIVRPQRSHPAVALLTPQGPQSLEPHGWQHFS